MSPEKHREIAAMGGRASHAAGTGHEWTREAARIAGAKGGKASRGGQGKRIDPPEPPALPPAEHPTDADQSAEAE